MAGNWPTYEPARSCTAGPTPGAKAFMAWALLFQALARNLGIFNCRTVRGARTTSTHGEGRSIDIGLPMLWDDDRQRWVANPLGWAIVRAILPHVGKLGVQCIIWDRTIWSAASPNGKPYTGVHPHYDHIHLELTWFAAMRLTLATILDVLPTSPPEPFPAPAPPLVPSPRPPATPQPVPAAPPTLTAQEADMFLLVDGVGIFAVIDGVPIDLQIGLPEFAALRDQSPGTPTMTLPTAPGQRMLAELLVKHAKAIA